MLSSWLWDRRRHITTLYSYIVATDSGFSPNPFHGICTLACCKPNIRKRAQEGDYVVGLGPKGSRIVYAMRVTEAMAFDDYWCNKRFAVKRPDKRAGGVQALGDNIYYRGRQMLPSQHDSGAIPRDTNGKRVLISDDFIYWGGRGPELPDNLRGLVVGRAHRSTSNTPLIPAFREWFEGEKTKKRGFIGWPTEGPPAPARRTANRRKRC